MSTIATSATALLKIAAGSAYPSALSSGRGSLELLQSEDWAADELGTLSHSQLVVPLSALAVDLDLLSRLIDPAIVSVTGNILLVALFNAGQTSLKLEKTYGSNAPLGNGTIRHQSFFPNRFYANRFYANRFFPNAVSSGSAVSGTVILEPGGWWVVGAEAGFPVAGAHFNAYSLGPGEGLLEVVTLAQ
jgi:hypothetical protein